MRHNARTSRPAYRLRTGSVMGTKHGKLGTNNQDAALTLEFGIPGWGTSYRIGLVSDGCSGIPAFTRSEVGSNLLVVYSMARIQELIVAGAKMEEIPLPLYHAVTNFLRDLANTVMPSNIYWPFPVTFSGSNQFRNRIKAPQRFITDYLAATILGFVDDGEALVTFQAGDGVRIINDDVHIVDQNNQPDYPALSVSSPGAGFQVNTYASDTVRRIALATDGVEKLLAAPQLGLPEQFFTHATDNPMGLQFLLNQLRKQYGQLMGDDCTIVTMERTNKRGD
jgi:hypothetical protein